MKKTEILPKNSHKNKGFMWIMSLLCVLGVVFSSCATQYSKKMYADVIGFNDSVMLSYMQPSNNQKDTDVIKPIPGAWSNDGRPYNLLNPAEATDMRNAINRVPSGQNTAALFALDVGLDRIVEVNKKFMEGDPNSKYYIVFFTDGIDNASVVMANRNKRGNYPMGTPGREAYSVAMNKRMQQILRNYSFFGLVNKPNKTNIFQSYVLLFQGDDLSSYSDEHLELLLNPFLANQNIDIEREVIMGYDMNDLLMQFKDQFIIPTFSFSVPKDYVGRRIRMLLNDREDIYFEGDLRHQTKTECLFIKKDYFTLENITVSDGLTFKEHSTKIEMDKEVYDANANTVSFNINEIKLRGKSYSIRRELVTQWHQDFGNFVRNSEYIGTGGGQKNAYILLIMDTSLSLGDYAEDAKKTAAEIITFISEQM